MSADDDVWREYFDETEAINKHFRDEVAAINRRTCTLMICGVVVWALAATAVAYRDDKSDASAAAITADELLACKQGRALPYP